MNDKNIMSPGKKVILTYNSPFVDSDTLFIEYNDIIRCTGFALLQLVHDSDELRKVFDTSDVYGLTPDELYEWYINRKDINIFKNFKVNSEFYDNNFNSDEEYISFLDDFQDDEISALLQFNDNYRLKFFKAALTMSDSNATKDVYIYTERNIDNINDDIKRNFNSRVKYVYGDFETVLKENNITRNSSFVFSDINKIEKLNNAGLLPYSSILLGEYYGYNYDENGAPKVDIDKLADNNIFKMYFFNATELLPNENLFSDEDE